MGQFANDLAGISRGLVRRATSSPLGLFSGLNPSKYNPSDPMPLWVIQVALIIAFTQLLSVILGRIRQPRVIAEVIGGVLLGPTVLGRIPGFTAAIFPDASIPVLTLTSTIGLVIFLFLVGLEIDVRIIRRNIKASIAISAAGLLVPLGLGAALGVGIYRQFVNPTVNFGYFVLFSAVAVGITAFPVLCRILTETKLLDTTVGVVTLSAGVGNDVVGWILLALTVALVNAGNGITALYVLLTSVGFVLFMLYPVRWAYRWLAMRTGCLETGQPSKTMMTLTLLIVFVAAFFTDVIGVHPIFGGFLAGLIIPHENGYAIAVVEKLEDLVSIIFLPLYFTLSGLRTNLGLLNNGVTWGWTILLCTVSFLAKSVPCFTAAKLFGFNLRESAAIGALMSCKGLVELIVLNVGLSAGILDTRTFSMFVVHAIILTFMTTPITLWVYPPKYRTLQGVASDKSGPTADEAALAKRFSENEVKTKFAVILDKIEQLPAAMILTQLLQSPAVMPFTSSQVSTVSDDQKAPDDTGMPTLSTAVATPSNPRITIDVLRLIELTDRTSAVFKSHAAESIIHTDPVVSVFRTFGYLSRMFVSAALNIVSQDEFSSSIATHALECESQLVIVPWCRSGSTIDEGTISSAHNPFDGIFNKAAGRDQTSSVVYSNFIRKVFSDTPTDVALFVDRGTLTFDASLPQTVNQHLFLPFFGGPDDRLSLSFVVQLCANPTVTATVVRMKKTASNELSPVNTVEEEKAAAAVSIMHNSLTFADTVYGHGNTTTRLESETADTLLWDRYASSTDRHSPAITSALDRIDFSYQSSSKPLHAVLNKAASEVQRASGRTLVVVVGRSRRLATESHQAELRQIVGERGLTTSSDSVPRTLGDVGAALVASGTSASILVMQACL